jgi:hypothetical protein
MVGAMRCADGAPAGARNFSIFSFAGAKNRSVPGRPRCGNMLKSFHADDFRARTD